MDLPIELKNMIESELENKKINELQENAENISLKYRNESGKGKRLVTKDIEALSYSAVRMPATYSAICTTLSKSLEIHNCSINNVLDIGAGTGAGSWAVSDILDIEKITCIEREDAMIKLGKKFMVQSDNAILNNTVWKQADVLKDEIADKADLVICSYMLNELNKENRENVVKKLWNSTEKMLLIVEPGTPEGFKGIKEAREFLMSQGGRVIAPCPNVEKCPLPDNDWCHATCRVARTKIHKILKSGDVPYEDEKFSYIAVLKGEDGIEEKEIFRVLRHPKIESGRITLKLCTEKGIIEKTVTKKEKELFKIARKLKCGDYFEMK